MNIKLILFTLINIRFRTCLFSMILAYILIFFSCSFSIYAQDSYSDYNYSANYSLSEDDSVQCIEMYDPFESFNRKIFAFNNFIDKLFIVPLAKTYNIFTTPYIRARVGNFIDNISSLPWSFVNYGLQRNAEGMVQSFWRFVINSTLGILGIFDVASLVSLNPQEKNLASSFAFYGIEPGPYIVLPLLGGITLRGSGDLIMKNQDVNPSKIIVPSNISNILMPLQIVHVRSQLLKVTSFIERSSADPYVAVRYAIYQSAERNIVYPRNFRCKKRNYKK